MVKIKFEYRITLIYLTVGALWILFSDNILNALVNDAHLLTKLQTFKGWFYVFVTGLLFFTFLKRHLSKLRTTEQELEKHREHLQELVLEKTKDLDAAIEELNAANEELSDKNLIITNQNTELQQTISDLKTTQSHLLQTEKMASVGVLTAGVAHEINNPLNYILGASVGLERYFEKNGSVDPAQTNHLLSYLKSGIERAAGIVQGLNQFSRVNQGRNDEPCDINRILENCITVLNHEMKHRIAVEKRFQAILPALKGNSGNLHQAFMNLILNACEAIEDEGTVTITTAEYQQHILINIKDNGMGIKPDYLPKIFDPFFTTKDPGKGTGLGLSITYKIIKELQGTIAITSEFCKGTHVSIKLPINL